MNKRAIIAGSLLIIVILALLMIYILIKPDSHKNTQIKATSVIESEKALEKNIATINWITEAWPNFTQEDGQGVYHDLIRAIFEPQNININIIYAPWTRSVENVRLGLSDMTGGIEKSNEYHQSIYPIYEYNDLIVYKKGTFTWNGLESLIDKKGVWVKDYIDDDVDRSIKKYARGVEMETHLSALMFLVAGRADYFLTERIAFENFSKEITNFDYTQYETTNIASGQLYFSFTKNERGKACRDLYDKGFRSLTKKEIDAIYQKWDLTAPLIE